MGDFLSKAISFRLTCALVAGVLLCEFIGFAWWWWFGLSLFGLLLISIFFSFKNLAKAYHFDWLFGLGILILVASLGFFRTNQYKDNQSLAFDGKEGIFEVTLADFPSEKQNSVLAYAELNSYLNSSKIEQLNGKIILYLAKDSNSLRLKSGDKLLITTELSLPQKKNNPDEFDFGTYMQHKGYCASGYVHNGHWRKIGEDKSFSIFRLSQNCRIYLLDILKEMNLSGDEFGLAAALTLGYRDAINPELRDSYAATGATHVLSVSGLHVGVVYVVLNFLLSFMDKGKRKSHIKSVIIIVFLWFYSFIAGLCPSICRATLMFSLLAVGTLFNKKPSIYDTIFNSAFILLIINPLWIFDLGFQLSYSALLSIVYFQPRIVNLFNIKSKAFLWLWELTSVSIAAQLGTAPIALYYFSQFPYYFLLSNIVVIPISSLIIYFATALFALYKVPFLNTVIAFCLEWILKMMNFLVRFIENLPNALGITYLTFGQMLLLYGVVFAFGYLCYKREFRPILFGLACLTLFFVSVTFQNFDNHKFNELVIFNDNRNIFVNVIDNNQNMVLANDFAMVEKLAKTFWRHHNCQTPIYENFDSLIFAKPLVFDNKKILILTDDIFYKTYAKEPLRVDYLVVTKDIFPNDNLLKYYFSPETLIVAGNVSSKNSQKFGDISQKYGVKFYSVGLQGAFVIDGNE
ncbi:MAG: ComEC family competence protein [Prevotellaceae bacterium]|jgi:competence protein ComEC|nr:ComEC family competence protein [Prevotellaceae bacterium]